MSQIDVLLGTADDVLEARWSALAERLHRRFHREVSLEGILFLLGIQTRGRGYEAELEKETKQELIMEGTYRAFEAIGLYERVGMDADGFWIWQRTQHFPELDVEAQEKLLRLAVLRYFDELEAPAS